jgi:uncharacterized protein DUF3427
LDKIRDGRIELPPGCQVTYDLEAIDMLRELLRTREGDELVKSYYTDFRERHGQRPTASEAFHDGYNPRSLRPTFGSWLRFVRMMGDSNPEQEVAFSSTHEFLDSLETTPMTRSFKMLTLLALLNEDKLPGEMTINELTESFVQAASRSPKFQDEVGVSLEDEDGVKRVLEQNPIAAWTGGRGTGGVPYFKYEKGVIRSSFNLADDAKRAFQEMVREIVDWRLAQYLTRGGTDENAAAGFVAKVSHSAGRPLIFLPGRARVQGIPLGDTHLVIDGERYIGNFVKVALNVIHKPDSDDNLLPDLLRKWFGLDAGRPGTSHEVTFSPGELSGAWTMSPSGRPREKSGPELWRPYMREEIPPIFGLEFNMAIWNSGFVKVPGHLFLLVTLEKEGLDEKFKYKDGFQTPDTFQWQSQNRMTQNSKHAGAIRDHGEHGLAVHLFVRRFKRVNGGGAAPFLYCGDVDFQSWSGNSPITVQWRLQTPVPKTLWDALAVESKAGSTAGLSTSPR